MISLSVTAGTCGSNSKATMIPSMSFTAFSISRLLATKKSVVERTCLSCISTNSSKVTSSDSSGKFTRSTFETSLRLASMRFSIRSFTVRINCSSLSNSFHTSSKYASMFIEVHVKVTMPGLILNSKFSMWGLSKFETIGFTSCVTRRYSLRKYDSSWLYVLNFCSCSNTILAASGISMPPMRSMHLVSRMSCRISASKLTWNRMPSSGCLIISVACKPVFTASMEFTQA
mmetsp:Transcript_56295/g.182819  ORF Transcript_56295/g.182819 Transcript_56295/m.182819 type:complete len:230 (-) Transcript_56295:2057-2746(-)